VIDFSPLRKKEATVQDLAAGLTRTDLVRLANEMCDAILERITGAEDSDTSFVPEDSGANDTFAANEADVNLPWTLGHVVIHALASSEESAALALTLARGLEPHERSRYEGPWEDANSVAFLHGRIEESRRMQVAMLDAWPDEPHMETKYVAREGATGVNAIERFVYGLAHSDSHLAQIANVLDQAKTARATTT
jgi:hypothetical protein